jgi:hypothetical protein
MTDLKRTCPICSDTMSPLYNGNSDEEELKWWCCDNEDCVLSDEGFKGGILLSEIEVIDNMQQRIAELEKAYTLLCKAHSAYTPVRWQDTYNKCIELATPEEAKP